MPTVGTTVRVSAIATNFNGDECVNTWDLRVEAAGTGGTNGFRTAAKNWVIQMYDDLESVIALTVEPNELRFYAHEGTEFIAPIAWTENVFAASGEELPAQLAGYIIGRTGTRGIRARKFMFPTIEGNNTAGVPTSGYKSQLLVAAGNLLPAFTDANGWQLQPVVWSTNLLTSVEFIDVAVADQWGTQRRRRAGRGS